MNEFYQPVREEIFDESYVPYDLNHAQFLHSQPNCYIVDQWEVDRERVDAPLEKSNEIGNGQYGIVYGGKYNSPEGDIIPCAVKTLKPLHINDPTHCQNFLNEAQVMK